MARKKLPTKEEFYREVEKLDLIKESEDGFAEYMTSTIARMIPSFIDGFLPVQRRILWAAYHDLKVTSKSTPTKVNTISGEVAGHYHTTGDTSVSGAVIRLGQNFELRYPFIDGHKTQYGAIGMGAAAPRYLKASTSKYAEEIFLKGTSKITAPFIPTYNNERTEPLYLASVVPGFFLMSSAASMAVGIKGQRVPHNLHDLIESFKAYVENKNVQVKTLVNKLQGPDFPTWGEVINSKEELIEIYSTGKGTFTVRGTWHEEIDDDGFKIVIDSLPFGEVPENFIEEINKLINEKTIRDIIDIEDQSGGQDEEGRMLLRMVIYVKTKKSIETVINQLIKFTSFQNKKNRVAHWGMTTEMKPMFLGIKEIYELFLNERYRVLKEKHEYELSELQDDLHIQEGFQIAAYDIDKVISIIRNSEGREEAKQMLMKKLKISEIQAERIGARNLFSLTKIDVLEIENKINEIQEKIKELKSIIKRGEAGLDEIIIQQLDELYNSFPYTRLTKITTDVENREVQAEEKPAVQNRTIFAAISNTGFICAVDGVNIDENKDWYSQMDSIINFPDNSKTEFVTKSSLLNDLVIVSSYGGIYNMNGLSIPMNKKGMPIQSILSKFEKDEKVIFVSGKEKKMNLFMLGNNGNGHIIPEVNASEIKEKAVWYGFRGEGGVTFASLVDEKTEALVVSTTEGLLHILNFYEDVQERPNGGTGTRLISIYEGEEIDQVQIIETGTTDFKIGKKKIPYSQMEFTKKGSRGLKLKNL